MSGQDDDWSWFGQGQQGQQPPPGSAPGQPAPPAPPYGQPAPAPQGYGQPQPQPQSYPQPQRSAWDAAPAPVAAVAPAPPVALLWAALGVAVVAALLGVLAPGRPLVSGTGWLLGGFVAVGLVTVFTFRDTRARTNPRYLVDPSRGVVRVVVLAVCAVAVLVHAWFFADWASRL